MTTPEQLARFVSTALAARADPAKAPQMAAYMKTTMPFYGVQKPDREPIHREMKARFAPASQEDYGAKVLALWALPHREERYAAIAFARQHERFVTSRSLPLYERLVREGAWWDFVDEIAAHLVGGALKAERAVVQPVLERWIDDEDLWIRRGALLSQIRLGAEADDEMLLAFVRKRAHDKEFFIRKAIGWALRERAKTAPEVVRDFLLDEGAQLSPLSYREAARPLVKAGLLIG